MLPAITEFYEPDQRQKRDPKRSAMIKQLRKGTNRHMKQTDNEKRQMDETVRQTLLKFTQDNLYMRNLKIEILDMEQGFVKAKMMVTKEILNPYGSVHGGCLYSLADIVTGVAACTYGYYSSTINGSMDYILPAMDTEYIICESVQIRQGKHVSLYEANLYDDKEQLIDKGSFSFYMMNRPVVS